MKKVSSIMMMMLALGLLAVKPAFAAFDVERISSTSAIINIVVLLFAVICLVWALKIMSLVRGGLISKSWQMFTLGFCFLIAAQILVVMQEAEFLILPGYFATSLYLVMTITWLMGLYQARKVLG